MDELLSGLTSIDHQLRKLDLAPSGSRSEDEGEEGLEDDHEGKWILIWGGEGFCSTTSAIVLLKKRLQARFMRDWILCNPAS